VIVTPAIDLRSGRCVQLIGGSYDRQVIDIDDPQGVARSWETKGFATLHVVDLDAATGVGSNSEIVESILASGLAETQVGGGIRSTVRVDQMIDAGADRVVLGTRALRDRVWLEKVTARYPDRVIVAADICDGKLVTHGWKKSVTKDFQEELTSLNDLPLAALLVTAVHKEGLMNGPDLPLMTEVVKLSHFPVQAAGGIASIADIRALAEIGVSTVIVGMAF
jgi:phosphoribosylformimino-5-aminoimidazole carboxamide ribotide isomerase